MARSLLNYTGDHVFTDEKGIKHSIDVRLVAGDGNGKKNELMGILSHGTNMPW